MSGIIATTVTGRVVADAEKAPFGEDAIQARIAVNKRVKVGGEWVDQARFIKVVSWRGTAHSKVFAKGNLVTITGDLDFQARPEDKGGYYAPEIKVFEVDLHISAATAEKNKGKAQTNRAADEPGY